MLRLMICGVAAVSVGLVSGWALGFATQNQDSLTSSSVSTWRDSLASPSDTPPSLPEPAHADPPDDPAPRIRAADVPANPPPAPVQPTSVQTKASPGGHVGHQADKPRKRKRRSRDDDD
jgi:uncharacterized membrane protein